ncbi:MAG: hypothetical protein Q4B40_06450 [Clostridia bacterium]|nr:hypothetical protein [Clostridia bacterium]
MKRLIYVLICLIFALSLTACGAGDTSSQIMLLELTEPKQISEDIEFKIVDKNGETCIERDDVESVYVTYHEEKSRYLELRLTDEGVKTFEKSAKKRKAKLSIEVNGEILASPVIKDDMEENSVIVLGKYEDVMDWFNAITE